MGLMTIWYQFHTADYFKDSVEYPCYRCDFKNYDVNVALENVTCAPFVVGVSNSYFHSSYNDLAPFYWV